MQASSCQPSLLIWFPVFLTFCLFVCHPAHSLVMSLNQIWRDGSIEKDLFDVAPYEAYWVDICACSGENQWNTFYLTQDVFV